MLMHRLLPRLNRLHDGRSLIFVLLGSTAEYLGRGMVYEAVAQHCTDVAEDDAMIRLLRPTEADVLTVSEEIDGKWATCVMLKQEVNSVLQELASSSARRGALI